MSEHHDRLHDRLGAAAPPPPDLAALGTAAEGLARRRRARRRTTVVGVAAAAVVAAIAVPFALSGPDRSTSPAADDRDAPTTAVRDDGTAPPSCLPRAEVRRDSVEGEAVWARFCPGKEGFTVFAEVPSDALVTHLDVLADLVDDPEVPGRTVTRCRQALGTTYRLQIGYADGGVAEVTGPTTPGCAGRLRGGTSVGASDSLGVYGVAMTAFGRQHADAYDDATPAEPLTCPADPREPGTVDRDGASASLDTGWHLGVRSPMLMPLTAVRGIRCTWPNLFDGPVEGRPPTVEPLTPAQADRVRIGMHALDGAMADCQLDLYKATYGAVVEDRTGTRRAVAVIGPECSAVVRSEDGYGLGFAWMGPD